MPPNCYIVLRLCTQATADGKPSPSGEDLLREYGFFTLAILRANKLLTEQNQITARGRETLAAWDSINNPNPSKGVR